MTTKQKQTKTNHETWKTRFLAIIRKTALSHHEFSAEDVRKAFCRTNLGNPTALGAFAGCYRRAMKLGIISPTGNFHLPRTYTSGAIRIYKSNIFKNNGGEEGNEHSN
jgi:hypothetical protein